MIKKITKSLLLLFTAVTIGTSCSSSDDSVNGGSNESLLIGKWKVSEFQYPEEYVPCDYEGIITFKENKQYTEYDSCNGETYTGTYSLANNSLTVINQEFPIPYAFRVVTLTNQKMVLEATLFDANETKELITYTKVQ